MRTIILTMLMTLLAASLLCQITYSDALLKSAEAGNAKAQCDLGVCYYDGLGIDKDYNKSMEWFDKSAKQGYAEAQFRMAGFMTD